MASKHPLVLRDVPIVHQLPVLSHQTESLEKEVQVAGVRLKIPDEDYAREVRARQKAFSDDCVNVQTSLENKGIGVEGTGASNRNWLSEHRYIFARLEDEGIYVNTKEVYGPKSSSGERYRTYPSKPSLAWNIVALVGSFYLMFKGVIAAASVPHVISYNKDGVGAFVPGISNAQFGLLVIGYPLIFCAIWWFVGHYLFHWHIGCHLDRWQNKFYKPRLWPTGSDETSAEGWEKVPYSMPAPDPSLEKTLIQCYRHNISPVAIVHQDDIRIDFSHSKIKKVIFKNMPSFCYVENDVLALLK